MKTYLALLRGINVSGKNRIIMNDLKTIFKELNFIDITTYIQSGNIIFKTNKSPSTLSKIISEKIKKVYNYDVPVFILSKSELETTFLENPFTKKAEDTKKLYFCFLNETPKDTSKLLTVDIKDDKFTIHNNVVYLKYENGAGKTKLTNKIIERKLCVIATSRNWRTITKLLELMK